MLIEPIVAVRAAAGGPLAPGGKAPSSCADPLSVARAPVPLLQSPGQTVCSKGKIQMALPWLRDTWVAPGDHCRLHKPMKGKVYTRAFWFLQSLNKHLFSVYYGPGTVLGTGHEVVN